MTSTVEPTAPTTIVTDAQKTLKNQFHGKPVINAVVASYAVQTQELRNQTVKVWVERMLPGAEGVQLDTLGKIVGEPRRGRDDDDYRVAIGAAVQSNRCFGTIESILAVLDASAELDYWLEELYPVSMLLTVMEAVPEGTATEIFRLFRKVKGAGIEVSMAWSALDVEAGALTLASGDVEEIDSARGLANDAGTVGGFCLEYER